MNRVRYIIFAIYASFLYGNCVTNLSEGVLHILEPQINISTHYIKIINLFSYCIACLFYQILYPKWKWIFMKDIYRKQIVGWQISIQNIALICFVFSPFVNGTSYLLANSVLEVNDPFLWKRVMLTIPSSLYITGLLETCGVFYHVREELLHNFE